MDGTVTDECMPGGISRQSALALMKRERRRGREIVGTERKVKCVVKLRVRRLRADKGRKRRAYKAPRLARARKTLMAYGHMANSKTHPSTARAEIAKRTVASTDLDADPDFDVLARKPKKPRSGQDQSDSKD